MHPTSAARTHTPNFNHPGECPIKLLAAFPVCPAVFLITGSNLGPLLRRKPNRIKCIKWSSHKRRKETGTNLIGYALLLYICILDYPVLLCGIFWYARVNWSVTRWKRTIACYGNPCEKHHDELYKRSCPPFIQYVNQRCPTCLTNIPTGRHRKGGYILNPLPLYFTSSVNNTFRSISTSGNEEPVIYIPSTE